MKKELFVSVSLICLVALSLRLAFHDGSADSATAPYPSQPITLMVPYSTGGGTDVTARLLVETLRPLMGTGIIVLNLTGAGGWNGWSRLAREKPDGYFIGYVNIPNIFTGYLDPRLGRSETLNSFTPIILHVVDPCIWAVRPESSFQSLNDVLQYAAENPLKVSIAAHGYGGDDHLGILTVHQMSGAQFSIVHNTSTAQSMTQVLAGDVDILAANVGEVKTRIEEGELRALGILWDKRSDFLPEVPTFAEQGYDIVMFAGRMIAGPKGLPEDRVNHLVKAVKQAADQPAYRKKMQNMGLALDLRTGDALREIADRNEQLVRDLMGW